MIRRFLCPLCSIVFHYDTTKVPADIYPVCELCFREVNRERRRKRKPVYALPAAGTWVAAPLSRWRRFQSWARRVYGVMSHGAP